VSSFFKKLFLGEAKVDPVIQFGRYTDHYKPRIKNQFWDKAMQLHEKKDYLNSIKAFFDYLSDDEINNINYIEEGEKIKFKIYQGSKCINGFANQDSFFAEAKLAKIIQKDLGVFRVLLEENYQLQYCSFALDSDDNITLTMHSEYEDASPYKLYYGLKEMAVRADKRDDVFVEKFENLSPIQDGDIKQISSKEKEIKYRFFKIITESALEEVAEKYELLKSYPALIVYRFLSTAYIIDFLLKPEGVTMELIDKINDVGLTQKFLNPEQRNRELIKQFKKLQARTKEELSSELYETKSTFGSMNSGNHLRLKEMVQTDLQHYNWYVNNGFENMANHIPIYIASSLLYTYAMPKPDKKLLELCIRLSHNTFFTDLGFNTLINDKGINKLELKKYIKEIKEEEGDSFTGLEEIMEQNFDYSSIPNFIASLLIALSQIDIKKKSNATA
jgi:hypothetical protein